MGRGGAAGPFDKDKFYTMNNNNNGNNPNGGMKRFKPNVPPFQQGDRPPF